MRKESSHYYIPEVFSSQVAAIKEETLGRLVPMAKEPLFEWRDWKAVGKSLAEFTEEINKTQAEALTGQYRNRKREAVLSPEGQLVFTADSSLMGARSWYLGEEMSSDNGFYIDGVHGLGSGFRKNGDSKTIWLAILSFSPDWELQFYSSRLKEITLNMTEPLPVVILQLQGRNCLFGENKEEARSLLGSFYWERLLVELMIDWAVKERVPQLFLLPATMNKYNTSGSAERLRRRYDGTAEICGFEMQPNGLWGLNTGGFSAAE